MTIQVDFQETGNTNKSNPKKREQAYSRLKIILKTLKNVKHYNLSYKFKTALHCTMVPK